MPKLELTVSAKIIEGTSTERASMPIALEDATVVSFLDDGFNVSAGAVDVPVSFGATTPIVHLALKFGSPLTFRINSSTAPQIVFGKAGCLVLSGCTVSSLYVSNPGTAAVKVDRIAAD